MATACIYILYKRLFYPRNVLNNLLQNYLQHSQISELCAQLYVGKIWYRPVLTSDVYAP